MGLRALFSRKGQCFVSLMGECVSALSRERFGQVPRVACLPPSDASTIVGLCHLGTITRYHPLTSE
jgi:hypothetical protein